jgi:hypothetical protein
MLAGSFHINLSQLSFAQKHIVRGLTTVSLYSGKFISSCKALKLSSSSIGTATLVGFGLLNYRWEFSAGRFLQGAVASGTSNPQLGGPVIRTSQLPPPRLKRREWTPAAEGGTMGEKFPRILPKVATCTSLLGSFTCCKLRHGTDGFTSPLKERVLRTFSPEKYDGLGRVWTRELGYRSQHAYL